MKKLGVLAIGLVIGGCAILAQGVEGDWRGDVDSPLGNVELIFHFREVNDQLDCSIETNFQGGVTVPCEVTVDEDQVQVEVPLIRGRYQGTLEGNRIEGEWTQAGLGFELNLRKL